MLRLPLTYPELQEAPEELEVPDVKTIVWNSEEPLYQFDRRADITGQLWERYPNADDAAVILMGRLLNDHQLLGVEYSGVDFTRFEDL